MAKLKVIDLIDWDFVPNKNSKQKMAIRKAVKKLGNSAALAKEMSKETGYTVSRQLMSLWINKELIKRNQNLMSPRYAKCMRKVAKIKGLDGELCPKAKKENKL